VAVGFIGVGNRSTRRKRHTCRKSLTNLSHNVVSSTPRMSGIRTHSVSEEGRRGRDCMVVGYTITYAISANHH
jgi:hypothetical protein